MPGLAFALELGVDALEFDVTLTADRQLILSHDLTVSALTSADTAAATPGDEMFPYVGKAIKNLTQYQIRTLDAGVRRPKKATDPFAATQVALPDTRMPTLGAVLGLVGAYGADKVRLHVELKSDPTRPDLSPDHRLFTELVLAELERHGRLASSAILSFDWRVLECARDAVPHRFALIEADTVDPAWLAGSDIRDLESDIPAAAEAVGATALSPDHVMINPLLMTNAALRGLPVVAWTVNEPERAATLIELGVGGIVTDYPDRMRDLWSSRGMPLPAPVRAVRHAALT
ncbi:putative glycerophosphoryl diester phosphodiesterase precursor (GlpQ) [Acrocarpospora phusangensis]|uniref:Glycerophosphoryl diester phosphodiesterase (GlpQ) n=1 Tax=Acrocarpospora phusangensis TaxID=1070424 RepID=A0A919QIS5_9ACTN|nr:putative glycerophosphoryl diester phosphodiesterase precursor (GlpQ) [Acrocarpospora phusangensis]